jgi:CheY-like chemotaxis protein
MGLGLTTAYNIMKKHDGYIHVESKAGEGTIIFLYLPAKKPVHFSAMVEDKGKAPTLKSASILVMDDEETVRSLTQEIFERLGFKAVLACDGDEAVRLYKEAMAYGMPFDLVFLDLTVRGGMGGKEAMERLLDLDPSVKAIVTSGYDNDPVITDFRTFGFSAAMPKPFSFVDLKKTLISLLGTLPTPISDGQD